MKYFLKSHHQKNYVLMNKWFYLKGNLMLSNTILKTQEMGLKNYVLSGIVGIIYNLKTHTGSIMPCPGQPDLQALGNIVLELVQHVPHFQWYKLYFDNW